MLGMDADAADMGVGDGTDLWTFTCAQHGDFDVWGSEVHERHSAVMWSFSFAAGDGNRFVPDDIKHAHCPVCGKPGKPVGAYEG